MASVVDVIRQFRRLGRAESDKESAPVTHQDQGWSRSRIGLAPDALGVPETNRSNERVSNWKVHRTCGSPVDDRRPNPSGSRARRGIIASTLMAGAASNQIRWL